jgi:hypothetical protein
MPALQADNAVLHSNGPDTNVMCVAYTLQHNSFKSIKNGHRILPHNYACVVLTSDLKTLESISYKRIDPKRSLI